MKRIALALALAVVAGAPAGARAQGIVEYDKTPKSFRTPQRFMLELKGGAYSPEIDSTPGLHGKPFSDLFNDQFGDNAGKQPKDKPLFTIEFDWQFLRGFGTLGLGVSAGFTRRTTHAFRYADAGGKQPCFVPTCTRSGDETALTVFPLALELVYRFDVLAVRYRVPVVPYFKGGLGYYFWFIQRGDSSLAKSLPDASGSTSSAIGGTPGLVMHPGLSIMLDAIDASAGRTLDAELGINHVHVFAELHYAWITGLGIWKDKMVFSDVTWNTGLGFEF